MIIEPQFATATLKRRYKRFLADLEDADGRMFTVHCPNTGAMTGCAEPGSEAWYSTSDNAKRKYPHTLEVVVSALGRVGVNTGRANALIAEALEQGPLQSLAAGRSIRREVKSPDGKGRFDLALSSGDTIDAFIEVKNMTLAEEDGTGLFPDAVSERARKHVESLVHAADDGFQAALVFCVQHTGIRSASPARLIDPAYAEALTQAAKRGVDVYACGCRIERNAIVADTLLPVEL